MSHRPNIQTISTKTNIPFGKCLDIETEVEPYAGDHSEAVNTAVGRSLQIADQHKAAEMARKEHLKQICQALHIQEINDNEEHMFVDENESEVRLDNVESTGSDGGSAHHNDLMVEEWQRKEDVRNNSKLAFVFDGTSKYASIQE